MQKRSGAAAGRGRATARPRTLAIDVGGTGLKASVLDPRGGMITDRLRVATPAPAPAKVLVDALVGLVAPLGGFERVSIGFPGVVRDGRVMTAPHFGTKRWAPIRPGRRAGETVRQTTSASPCRSPARVSWVRSPTTGSV